MIFRDANAELGVSTPYNRRKEAPTRESQISPAAREENCSLQGRDTRTLMSGKGYSQLLVTASAAVSTFPKLGALNTNSGIYSCLMTLVDE